MTPTVQGDPANIRINVTLPETRVIGLHLRHKYMGLSSFNFSWWVPKNTLRSRVGNGRSKSSKVVNFGSDRKRVCNFLLIMHSNLGPILSRFGDVAGFLINRHPTPIPREICGCYPWTRSPMLGLRVVPCIQKYRQNPFLGLRFF